MMKWIGLTGGIATGKSTVAQRLRTLGYAVLDADEISHQVTNPVPMGTGEALPEIFQTFGDKIKAADGSLDRKALGDLIFGQKAAREKLEAIVHPLVRGRVAAEKSRLEKENKGVAFYDVPLLYEKKMEQDFDAVVVVTTTPEMQLERLMRRNSLTESQARARLDAQMSLREKEAKTKFVIHNSGDLEFLEREIARVLRELKI